MHAPPRHTLAVRGWGGEGACGDVAAAAAAAAEILTGEVADSYFPRCLEVLRQINVIECFPFGPFSL